jgi:hypothetical protein
MTAGWPRLGSMKFDRLVPTCTASSLYMPTFSGQSKPFVVKVERRIDISLLTDC